MDRTKSLVIHEAGSSLCYVANPITLLMDNEYLIDKCAMALSKYPVLSYKAFISYISAFFPILLICLTWLCIHLHGRNFRPLVWLWRPFHRYFVQLQRSWDTKSDIIDVFITFFFLTYSKMMYQPLLLVANRPIRNIEPSGEHFSTYVSVLDHSTDIGSAHHLLLTIPVILVSLTFNLLLHLLLGVVNKLYQ